MMATPKREEEAPDAPQDAESGVPDAADAADAPDAANAAPEVVEAASETPTDAASGASEPSARGGKALAKKARADQPGDPATELREAIWPPGKPAPLRTLRCRHCKRRNRVAVPEAIMRPERHRCGRCEQPLFLSRQEPLTGISALAYQHSLDRRSTAAITSIPGAAAMLRLALERVGDRSAMMRYMSDAILCSQDQFPELLEMVDQARERLDIRVRPKVFLGESPHMNALTTGVRDPIIVVGAALLDQMDNEQVIAVLGHELGHLHSEHPLHMTLAHSMLQGAANASPLIAFFGLPIHRLLLRWGRCAELTADRAALLACRDLSACITVMLRFAGGHRPGTSGRTRLRLSPFIEQCRELARMQAASSVDVMLSGMLAMDRTHPHLAWRVMHLMQWVEHGNYLDILAGDYLRRPGTAHPKRLTRGSPP